jgi:hypothetical protein
MRIIGKTTFSLVFLLLAAALSAGAQEKRFEITPYASYLFGGSFDLFDFEFGRVDFELEEDAAFGVHFDIPISPSFQVELTYLKQDTTLQIDEGLFADDFPVADIEIDTFLVGILWQGTFGQVQPFFVGSVGLSDLSLDLPGTDNEVQPAFSIGGGVKTMFTENLGLRFEGRILGILIDEDERDFCCRYYEDGQSITQGQVSAGLIFAF